MKPNNALKVLFTFNSIFVFAGSILGPLYAIYVEHITNDIIAVSISWSVFTIVATLGTYFVSMVGDRIKEKEYLLLAGYLFRSIGWFGFLFVTNLTGIIIVQIILALGEATGTPAFDVIFAEHLDKKIKVKEYSIWKVLSNLFSALGAIAGGWMVSTYGFPVIFIAMSVLALVSFVGILLKPRSLL